MNWRPDGDGVEIKPPRGEDATVWEWQLVNDDGGRRTVLVFISGSAMSSENVSFRVDRARRSRGQTEIAHILDWQEPPKEIILYAESQAPTIRGGQPGPEVRELAEIVGWFEERDLLLLFTARGRDVPGGAIEYTMHSANVVDWDADELVERFEARARLAAARAARDWWVENREVEEPRGVELDLQPAEGRSSASLELETPRISSEQREHLDRREINLVVTGPDTDDPDSGWMFEAYKDGKLLALAVAATVDDAWLTLYEELFPEGSE